jgi:hypothetical protein
MIADRYTKAVLTVIAGCLLWMCAMGAGRPLSAQQPAGSLTIENAQVQPVVIVGTGTLDPQGKVTVNYVRHDGGRRTDPTLAVTLPYTPAKPMPVGLPYTTVNPMPSQLFYTGATPLPVEISAVKKVGDWEPLRARVEDAPAKPKPGGPPEKQP